MHPVVLLGPQRLRPHLATELDRLRIDGPVAVVTAGWQEREAEDDELAAHLGRPVVDLRLHGRAEEIWEQDPELFAAHRERQDRLRGVQELYRYRLDFVIEPLRELLRREGDRSILEPERESAMRALRMLDNEHVARIRAIHREFQQRYQPLSRRAVRRHRRELRSLLGEAAAVGIAGGHVAILINRLRLFGFDRLLTAPQQAQKPLFAWSGGAMVCADRVILFHDSPPQGAGNAEVFELGLGLAPGVVPLPWASQRLRLSDQARVGIFAGRFTPRQPILLDPGAVVVWDGTSWRPGEDGARRLTLDGHVAAMEVAA